MSFIGVVIMAGVIATCFIVGIVAGVLLVMAVPLKRPPGHGDAPPPWPRRRG
jgi:hypothetical protein